MFERLDDLTERIGGGNLSPEAIPSLGVPLARNNYGRIESG